MSRIVEVVRERPEIIALLPKMEELLGLDGYRIPTGAFRELYRGVRKNYNRWTREILDKPAVWEALRGAETIVELGPGHEAAMTKTVAEILQREGAPLERAVLLDFNPTIGETAVASAKQAGIKDVSFEGLDLRTSQGLQRVQELGGSDTILVARALLNQLGRGADRIIKEVFPAYGKGAVLDVDHPRNNEHAWSFRVVNPDDQEAKIVKESAERFATVHYELLELDGRQLPGSKLGEKLERAGLNVVHHEVVPHDPKEELVTDIPFANALRLTAAIVGYNLVRDGTSLPVTLEEFDDLLTSFDRVLEFIQDERLTVTTIQFGGAVWSGQK